MARQSKAQKETVGRVMHEFKHGELRMRGDGPKVKNEKQAIAIALHEAGATNQESPKKNSRNLSRTKAKERQGRTAQAEHEGKAAQKRTMQKSSGETSSGRRAKRAEDGGQTKDALYQEARRQDIPGRSHMSKAELERALRH